MPALNATTTAVFQTVFGTTSSAIIGYDFFVRLFSQALSVGMWLVQAIWPFLLVVGILILFVKVAGKMVHWHR